MQQLLKHSGLKVGVLSSVNPAKQDLHTLGGMMEADQIIPAVDRTDPLAQTADAMRYFEEEHARAKVVITV